MKETRRKRWHAIFNTHTLMESKYEEDKVKVIQKYLSKGYRDAKMTKDSIYKIEDRFIGIDLYISEGKKILFQKNNMGGKFKIRL